MAAKRPAVPFKVGDRAKVRHSDRLPGRIVALCGPFGPGGAQVYRVRIRGKPRPMCIELREDQLVLVPAET
jgi:hypothetical protein